MPLPISDLTALLSHLEPERQPGAYVFATVDNATRLDLHEVVACMREPEGLSVVVPVAAAGRYGATGHDRFAWITLTVHSDLQAVGLTAAFASALGSEGISCNVVAGLHHDHIFVPEIQADAAMAALRALQANASALATGASPRH